ncbi:MAG: IS1634 family transposase, partial [Candidatus Saccharimonadales bacterium]
EQIQLAATQIISRTVYPASELRTNRWIKENSAICELTGYDVEKITKDKLYESALRLYAVKDALEKHLSKRTNDLFGLQDKIVLYDLTNTYFEGRKVNSKLAKHGRSKEKRSDAKLVVLALVINMEGFIKYFSIHEGNIADCKTLSTMIDKLRSHTCSGKAVIVLDGGISTADNLKMISEKGYEYLCVSRTKLKDYTIVPDRLTVLLETKSKQNVRIKAVATDKHTDYFLEVKSDAKGLKENAMGSQFEQRFEQCLESIAKAIGKKGGVKKADKVWERIGRAKEKYPSVHHYYTIDVPVDPATKKATALHWQKDYTLQQTKETNYGIYFLRTSLKVKDEVVIWNIYNTIREIENTFRTLKSELDLRPIYHKTDKGTMAHLHLGILAYWIVNTIRHQLKCHHIHHQWNEIVRIGNTQKILTTRGQNTDDEIIEVRKSTEPEEKLAQLFKILEMPPRPFWKRKSVVHRTTPKKIESACLRYLPPG